MEQMCNVWLIVKCCYGLLLTNTGIFCLSPVLRTSVLESVFKTMVNTPRGLYNRPRIWKCRCNNHNDHNNKRSWYYISELI